MQVEDGAVARGKKGTVGMVRARAMPAVKVSPYWVARTSVAPPLTAPVQPARISWPAVDLLVVGVGVDDVSELSLSGWSPGRRWTGETTSLIVAGLDGDRVRP